jgi:hypothetical protein
VLEGVESAVWRLRATPKAVVNRGVMALMLGGLAEQIVSPPFSRRVLHPYLSADIFLTIELALLSVFGLHEVLSLNGISDWSAVASAELTIYN